MNKIIGITGKAGSGKDAIATYLFAKYGFTRIAFADPLKLAAQQMFGLTEAQTWDPKLKEVEIDYWGITPRRIFQLLGTEGARNIFGDDFWIKRAMLSIQQLGEDDIVIPDVRFDNEAEAIRKAGGTIVHLTRPSLESSLSDEAQKHVSEAGVTKVFGDFCIENSGTLHALSVNVDMMLREMESRSGN